MNPQVQETDMHKDYIKQAERRIGVARAFIIRRLPVVASAMARTEVVIQCSTAPGQMPAASTDCYRTITVDARRIAGMTDAQAIFLLVHEVAHKMLNHGRRSRATTRTDGLSPRMVHQLTNVAQDFITNKMTMDLLSPLLPAGLDLMPASDTMSGAPIPTTRDNFWAAMAASGATQRPIRLFDPTVTHEDDAERVYAYLLDTRPEGEGEGEGESASDEGSPSAGDSGGAGNGAPDGDQQPGDGKGRQPGDSSEEDTNGKPSGSRDATDKTGPLTEEMAVAVMTGRECGDDSGDTPKNGDGEPVTQGEMDTEAALTGQSVAMAAEGEKRAGSAAGWFNRLMDANRRPAINPRTLLERYVRRRTARSDYSLRRLRRVGMHFGMALPTLRSEEIGDLIVAIDTSGSVGGAELSQYASDIHAVQRVMRPTTTRVIYCDTRVAGEQSFKRGQKLDLQPKGGGGTKIVPVFQHIKKNRMKGDLLLYLTDGYVSGTIPRDLRPDMPVVWLVYDGSPRFAPTFGDVVRTAVRERVR